MLQQEKPETNLWNRVRGAMKYPKTIVGTICLAVGLIGGPQLQSIVSHAIPEGTFATPADLTKLEDRIKKIETREQDNTGTLVDMLALDPSSNHFASNDSQVIEESKGIRIKDNISIPIYYE